MPLHRLSGLRLNRVDLVPDGSNPDAHVVLFKAKKEATVPAPKKKVAKKTPKPDSRKKTTQRGEDEDDDDEEDIALSREDDDDEEDEEDEETVEKADDDDDEDAVADEDDEEEEEEKPRKKVAKAKGGKGGKAGKGGKGGKKVKKAAPAADDDDALDDEDDDTEDEPMDEQVLKGLPRAAQTLLTKMSESLSAMRKTARRAEKTANVEKAKRERLEFIEKAKKDIPSLTGTAEEKGDLIQALYSGEPVEKKTADAIVKLLKSGDAAVRSMMSESGRGRATTDEEDSAVDQLREKAEAIRKVDPKLTKEQAFEKACYDNRDLFTQYKVEKRRRSSDQDAH
jgi:hypothetical protein